MFRTCDSNAEVKVIKLLYIIHLFKNSRFQTWNCKLFQIEKNLKFKSETLQIVICNLNSQTKFKFFVSSSIKTELKGKCDQLDQ